MAAIDPGTLDNLIACRDLLAFTLTDQHRPPDELAAPMWEVHNFLHQRIEAEKRETGFVEPGITIYAPKRY